MSKAHNNAEETVVFTRPNLRLGRVLQKGDLLFFEIAAGADANHDPRIFTFPISEAHLAVLRIDSARHILFVSAFTHLANAAGAMGEVNNEDLAVLLDGILLDSNEAVEALLVNYAWSEELLVAYGADLLALERGDLFAALESVTDKEDWQRVQEYVARRNRGRQGVVLAPVDEAILRYTGQYLHGATIPARRPNDVDAKLLSTVLEIVSVAEKVGGGTRLTSWKPREYTPQQKAEWKELENAVKGAVKNEYPTLAEEAVRSLSNLVCSEAVARIRRAP